MRPKTELVSRIVRHRRIRSKVSGTSSRPRLFVYRSNQHIYAQIIDDTMGKTLFSATEKEIKAGKTKVEKAILVGELIAKKAAEKQIKEVVFDRGGYIYHGRVKGVADGARKGGLVF
jgi:large subunit ribosomal protein L18